MAVQQGPKKRGPGACWPGLFVSLVARERGVLQIRSPRTGGRRWRPGQYVESAGGRRARRCGAIRFRSRGFMSNPGEVYVRTPSD